MKHIAFKICTHRFDTSKAFGVLSKGYFFAENVSMKQSNLPYLANPHTSNGGEL